MFEIVKNIITLSGATLFLRLCLGSSVGDIKENCTDENKTLQLVHVIFRHGDRTPIDEYPNDHYNNVSYWPEGWAQLSKIGKEMQYNLGKYFRFRYDGFIPRSYSPDQVYVQSSDVDRTIMSAQANLAGLFPPSLEDPKSLWHPNIKWQPIPVHSISKAVDNKIGFYQSCPRYTKLLNDFLLGPYMKKFDRKYASLYSYLSQNTGLNVTNYNPVSDLYDTLTIQKLYNLTLPTWTKSVYPNHMYPAALIWVQKFTFTNELRQLRAGPFLKEIFDNMKRVVGTNVQQTETLPPKAKLFMYAAHDNTITAILDALGLFELPHLVNYASSLMIELHRSQSQTQGCFEYSYFVKVFYRPNLDKDANELEIRDCGNPCYLNRLLDMKKDYLYYGENWTNLCATK